jgi:hypothetical protein
MCIISVMYRVRKRVLETLQSCLGTAAVSPRRRSAPSSFSTVVVQQPSQLCRRRHEQ